MKLFLRLFAATALLALSACSEGLEDDWDSINYASLACTKDSTAASCKTSPDDVNAIGKGKR